MTTYPQSHPKKQIRWPDWLAIVIVFLFIFNALPFLAPVLMKLGWAGPARLIYLVYAPLCHQMAQRSFFVFGPHGLQMYNLNELPINAAAGNIQLASRFFLGNEALGWKVAWSDRMVSMFGTPLLVAVAYAFLRHRKFVKPIPLWLFGLLLMPMILDGGTHMISDVAQGIGHGFRDSNEWFAVLTGHLFPASFYAGDALGSFNSLMRLFSGMTFGVAVGGLLYPAIDQGISYTDTPPSFEPAPTVGQAQESV
jgi:uncharacterized membrane protein